VVGYHGSGRVTYEEALAAVFIESWIFLFISLIGLRGRLIELVPKHIMLATAVGIGLFLSHIGFQQAEGMGLITFDPATLVALGELHGALCCANSHAAAATTRSVTTALSRHSWRLYCAVDSAQDCNSRWCQLHCHITAAKTSTAGG
jgi:AGZA family xanthine/uracil permease-like MFS transporter